MRMRASWNGAVLAESDQTVVVEGNHYFPPETVDPGFVKESGGRYMCHWKGVANYFDVIADGEVNRNAGWTYPNPTPAAENIRGYIAFWRGVQVEPVGQIEEPVS